MSSGVQALAQSGNQGRLVGIWLAGRGRGSRRSRAGAPGLRAVSLRTPWGHSGPQSARPRRHLQLLRLHVALGATVLAEVLPLAIGTLV